MNSLQTLRPYRCPSQRGHITIVAGSWALLQLLQKEDMMNVGVRMVLLLVCLEDSGCSFAYSTVAAGARDDLYTKST